MAPAPYDKKCHSEHPPLFREGLETRISPSDFDMHTSKCPWIPQASPRHPEMGRNTPWSHIPVFLQCSTTAPYLYPLVTLMPRLLGKPRHEATLCFAQVIRVAEKDIHFLTWQSESQSPSEECFPHKLPEATDGLHVKGACDECGRKQATSCLFTPG